jgi:D-glycero-D-manno-heptose 1,7-bisphosphate phosphatase
MSCRPFVVLDRDGTLVEERVYLSDPKQLTLLPGAADAMRQFRAMGFGLIVVTNQSAIARGFFDEAQLTRIHEELCRLLEAESVELDGIYFCPHKPEDRCGCRKPEPGLINLASKELHIELRSSIVIGDKACDIELGRRVGATTILVRTGYGAQSEETVAADYVVDDLLAAVDVIRKKAGNERNVIHDH